MRTLALAGCLLVLIDSAHAQQKALPEELAVGESVVMQEADELQTTAAVRYFKLPDSKKLTLAGVFEYGLSDRWQVEAEVPYVSLNPNSGRSVKGLGDVEFAARYAVRDFRTQPWALDVGLDVGVPTGDRQNELGEGRVSLEPFFIVSQWFGAINAQLHAGWQRAVSEAGDEPKNEFTYNLALVYPVAGWFLVAEGNGNSTSWQTTYYVTPEIIWHPRQNLEFLIASPCGVTHAAGDYGVIASVTLEFGNVTGRSKDND